MHILVLPSWYPTKDSPVRGSFFHEQVRALSKTDHTIGVVCSDVASLRSWTWNKACYYGKTQVIDDLGVPTYQCMQWNWFPFFHEFMDLSLIRKGMQLFEQYVIDNGIPDIIHAHSVFPAGLIALEIKKKFNVPFLITEHSSAFGRGSLANWQKKLAAECFASANKRMVVSPKLGETLNSSLQATFNDWMWVPNITSLRDSKAYPASNESQKSFTFLNVAMMTVNKGQADLLQAFALNYKGNYDVFLRIGGDGSIKKELESLAVRLGIAGQVAFLGSLSREQVKIEMMSCDVVVLSSHYETFGVVLIEALSYGKPVVATMCGGPECIVNDKNGILVQPKQPLALAKGMEGMHLSYKNYDSLLIANECHKLYGEEAVVNQLLVIYNEALSEVKFIDA